MCTAFSYVIMIGFLYVHTHQIGYHDTFPDLRFPPDTIKPPTQSYPVIGVVAVSIPTAYLLY